MTVEELMKTPIALWDVSSVKEMHSMFEGATSFNKDISKWDISNVRDMRWSFYNATSFNQDLEAWGDKLHKDVYMVGMFKGTPLEGNEPSWYLDRVSRV